MSIRLRTDKQTHPRTGGFLELLSQLKKSLPGGTTKGKSSIAKRDLGAEINKNSIIVLTKSLDDNLVAL